MKILAAIILSISLVLSLPIGHWDGGTWIPVELVIVAEDGRPTSSVVLTTESVGVLASARKQISTNSEGIAMFEVFAGGSGEGIFLCRYGRFQSRTFSFEAILPNGQPRTLEFPSVEISALSLFGWSPFAVTDRLRFVAETHNKKLQLTAYGGS